MKPAAPPHIQPVRSAKAIYTLNRWLVIPCGILSMTVACQDHCPGFQGMSTGEFPDVVVVENCGPGVWDEHSKWEVVEELRIGSGAGDGSDVFTGVQAITVDSRGRIFVADRSPARIDVFGPEGDHLRTLGRSGDGPGEFRWVVGLAVDYSDRLWAIDYGNQRYTVFDSAGSLARMNSREVGSWWMPWPGRLDGDLLYELEGSAEPSQSQIRVLDMDVNVVSTVPFPIEDFSAVPFGPDPIVALGPDGMSWSGRTDPYVLLQRNSTGSPVRALYRPLTGPRLTTRERREALETSMARQQQVAALAGEGGAPSLSIAVSDVPANEPVLRTIWIDSSGFLWVWLRGERAQDGRTYEIFDDRGVFQGEVTLPFSIKVGTHPHFRGDQMYAVTSDELGREFVVRVRIERH